MTIVPEVIWALTRENQSAHLSILNNTFDIRLESIISRLATYKISIFKLVSVAEQTDLSLTLSETPKA